MSEQHYRTCNLCEAMCGMVVTVDGGRVTDIRGDRDDVFSRGHICPKGPAMREVQEDPDRLRQPMRRTAKGWEKLSWDDALDEAATRLHAVQSAHGRDAVGAYVGNPVAHNHGAILMAQLFGMALGSRNKFDANSQDANPKLYAALQMFGDLTSLTVPDVDRTHYLLVLGANPLASNGSVMSLGDVRGRLKAIRARGGRLVLLDPRRTETAEIADEHLAIRPGGDAAFLLAVIHTLFAEARVDHAQLAPLARGARALEEAARAFSPDRVGPAVGIDAGTIRRIAREFAQAESAVAYGRMGICTGEFGPLTTWLVEALNVLTGNFDRPGGSMFASPAIDLAPLARRFGINGTGRAHTRVRKLPELGGQFPAATLADEIETPGAGQIRAMVTLAGNPVLSVPNGERLARAFDSLEYMVSIDLYLNETTRHAHLILPPRYSLERGHYDLLLHAIAVRNTAKWSPPVLPPEPDTREDWDILLGLSTRLLARRARTPALARLADTLHRATRLDSTRAIDLLLRLGPHGDKFNPLSKKGLTLARLAQSPHGVDLGPLVSMRHARVHTVDGRVDLAPAPLLADVARAERWLASPPTDLLLIGRRHLRSNNSWMHNVRSLTKGPDRATLLMHPDDARERGLAHGAQVRIASRVGDVTVRLEVSDTMRRGVVSLPHGYGHARAADTLRVAGALAGASANALTDEQRVEPLTGTAILNGVPVTVESAG